VRLRTLSGPRPIRTRFRCGSGRKALTSPHPANSPDHSSIGTPSGHRLRGNTLRLLVGTRFQFLFHSPPGVLFTFPSRYSFAIGHQGYLALGSGLPGFPLWRPSEWYSRYPTGGRTLLDTGLSPSSAVRSRFLLLTCDFVDSVADRQARASDLTTPDLQRLPPYAQVGSRLFPFRSPLLRECCLLLGVLRCFSSPGALPHSMDSSAGDQGSTWSGFPIRRSPDHRSLPTPRSFSQVTASFFGPWRQGIRRAPFVA
jgi:hypothetical protein